MKDFFWLGSGLLNCMTSLNSYSQQLKTLLSSKGCLMVMANSSDLATDKSWVIYCVGKLLVIICFCIFLLTGPGSASLKHHAVTLASLYQEYYYQNPPPATSGLHLHCLGLASKLSNRQTCLDFPEFKRLMYFSYFSL